MMNEREIWFRLFGLPIGIHVKVMRATEETLKDCIGLRGVVEENRTCVLRDGFLFNDVREGETPVPAVLVNFKKKSEE
jgi:hypothetical protein